MKPSILHKLANLSVVAEDLEKAIKQLKLEDDIRVRIDMNGLLLEFSERLVFTSGSRSLPPKACAAPVWAWRWPSAWPTPTTLRWIAR